MPTTVIADNFTPQDVDKAGGPQAVFQALFDRMWKDKLAHLRDTRSWVIRFVKPHPSPIPGDAQNSFTFALECHHWLADPKTAAIGEAVCPDCMPFLAIVLDSEPRKAIVNGHEFLITVNGWERIS